MNASPSGSSRPGRVPISMMSRRPHHSTRGRRETPPERRREPALRVLVIDDEQDILALCRVTLAHAGHEVLQACDADEGMRLARDERPDVILLDVMLPRRDGFSLVEELVA